MAIGLSRDLLAPWCAVGLASCLLASCGGEVLEVAVGRDAGDGGESTRLEIHVTVHDDDHRVAEALGWRGGVPGAAVYVARVDQRTYFWDTLAADEAGYVALEDIPAGIYWVAAERSLPEDAADALPSGARTAGILGGGEKVNVPHLEEARLDVPLRIDRPGSLVISEVFMASPPPWETGGTYHGSKFFELYNNGGQTAYLDGMLLAHAYAFWRELGSFGHHRCSVTEPMRSDAEGVWTDVIWQFPGSGSDHPVAPGETVLIAVAAADHTGVHSTTLDLSNADFELDPAAAGADNPAAPNLGNVGPRLGGTIVGWGLNGGEAFYVLASPVDVAGLPLRRDPGTDKDWRFRRIPADRILDVAVIWWDTSEAEVSITPPCKDPVHPSFDRLPGGYLRSGAVEPTLSASRRTVELRGGGSALLDTNTSKVDFYRSERTPGWIR